MWSHFDTVLERDRQTDTQTDGRMDIIAIPLLHVSIAMLMHDKNCCNFIANVMCMGHKTVNMRYCQHRALGTCFHHVCIRHLFSPCLHCQVLSTKIEAQCSLYGAGHNNSMLYRLNYRIIFKNCDRSRTLLSRLTDYNWIKLATKTTSSCLLQSGHSSLITSCRILIWSVKACQPVSFSNLICHFYLLLLIMVTENKCVSLATYLSINKTGQYLQMNLETSGMSDL